MKASEIKAIIAVADRSFEDYSISLVLRDRSEQHKLKFKDVFGTAVVFEWPSSLLCLDPHDILRMNIVKSS